LVESLFGRKISTILKLLRQEGVKGLSGYAWMRLQILTKERQQNVRIDGCTFNLAGVSDAETRIELMTNRYESAERRAIVRYLRRDLPVIELGGSMGVVACVTNNLLNDPWAHVVVEANPLAIPLLEQNRKLNGRPFEIVNRAIAYGADSVTFCPSTNLAGNSITMDGTEEPVTVSTVAVGELAHQRGFKRFSLVCDIEGVEYDLVCREPETLKSVDTIIMETHARYIGEDKFLVMMNNLDQLGFKIIEQIGFVVVLQQ
jgi:FkbM family methyltransferase